MQCRILYKGSVQCRMLYRGQNDVQDSVQGSVCSVGWCAGVSMPCRIVHRGQCAVQNNVQGSACSVWCTGVDLQ